MAPAGGLVACHHESFSYGEDQGQMLLQFTAPEITQGAPRAYMHGLGGCPGHQREHGGGQELENLKRGMIKVINWPRDLDRLCIVTFDDKAHLKYGLKVMGKDEKEDALRVITEEIQADGWTNIEAGLRMGLGVLQERQITNHQGVIFLLSDGAEKIGNARLVRVVDYAVETFGFGTDKDATILQDISRPPAAPPLCAATWTGGAYNDVTDVTKLTSAFSRPSYIHKHMVVKDLVVTLPVNPVTGGGFGSYPKKTVGGSTTQITLGDLFSGECFTSPSTPK